MSPLSPFQVDDLKQAMSDNLVKIEQRGIKIEDLESKAEQLESGAAVFQKSSRKLKEKSMLQNYKYKIIIAGVVALLILIILIIIFTL